MKREPIMPKKGSQEYLVLMHIKNRPLSAMEAFWKYDITDLAGRICRLKEKGWMIDRRIVIKKKEDGKVKHWKEYRLQALPK